MEKKTILVVDDDPETRLLLVALLGRQGYRLATFDSGADALRWLEHNSPDLAILDLMMPEMDGWQTYTSIRSRCAVPVIFLTALSAGENAARALGLGAADYIRKPFHNDELLARVQHLLGTPASAEAPTVPAWGRLIIQRPSVSVILPTWNEANNLPLVLPYIPLNWVDEVILVDGLSTDGTPELARELMPSIKVVMETTRGKGAALQAGYKAASGDILIVLDCDGSHDPREIPRFVTALMQGADIVKGSRFAPGGGTTDMPRYRQLGNGAFVVLVNLLFRATFTDLCYGYHAFWRYCLNSIEFPSAKGFEVDAALYLGALRDQLRITEVPSVQGYRFHGVGKLQTIRDGWRVLRTILGRGLDLRFGPRPVRPYLGFRGLRPGQLSGQPLPALDNTAPSELIEEWSHQLYRKPDLHGRMNWLLQNVVCLLQAHSGSFVLINEAGEPVLGILSYLDKLQPVSGEELETIIHRGLAGWVVAHRQPALVPDTTQDSRWMRRDVDQAPMPRSAMSVRLTLDDRVLGVLTVAQRGPKQFTHSDFALLLAIAGGVSSSSASLFVPASSKVTAPLSLHTADQPRPA